MAALSKTIVATGASSGLGFELIKQLFAQSSQPYRVVAGARDTARTQAAFDDLKFDSARHSLTVLPLELADLKGVKTFASQTLAKLGAEPIDYLFLNAGITNGAQEKGPNGSKWCEAYIVNHLSQHYLVHLLKDKLITDKSRIIFVSSGAVRQVPDTSVLDNDLLGGSGADGGKIYCETKFVQLLSAHWWRRQLWDQCKVVAVSPGLIPATGIGRGSGMKLTMAMPDAKSVPEGAENLFRAFTRDDFPEDPEQIFLTSWGEWWPKDVYGGTLDKALQEKWCPSKEEIEAQEGLA